MGIKEFEQTDKALLSAINKITSGFIASNNFGRFFEETLEVILKLTDSEYGFLSELLHDDCGKPFMRAYAISNIAWNSATHARYHDFTEKGHMDFHSLNNLFGHVLLSGEALISNDPMNDHRSGGFPSGHRAMDAYLGMPLIGSGKVLGMLAIANRPGGYHSDILEWLEPVRSTLSSIIISMRNERHRVSIERQLLEAKEASEKANESKGLFLATISHEIRTPMNAIVGMCDLLGNTPLTASQTYYAEVISRNSDLLLSIINDVLDVSKLEAGKMEVHQSKFNLEDLLYDVAELMTYSAAQKGVVLMMRYPHQIVRELNSDQAKIKQILINLVSNAVKFTEKGHVFVEVCSSAQCNIQIKVHDTGIGISESSLPNLFGLFHQADQGASRKYGGTGLGLAICQRFARLLGGDIQVESKKNVGSCFTLNLQTDNAELLPVMGKEVCIERKGLHLISDYEPLSSLFQTHFADQAEINFCAHASLRAFCEQIRGTEDNSSQLILIDTGSGSMKSIAEPSFQLGKELLVFKLEGHELRQIDASKFFKNNVPVGRLSKFPGFRGFEQLIQQFLENVSVSSSSTAATSLLSNATHTGSPPAAVEWPHQPSILLVEDNPINQDVASLVLTQMGCLVDVAFNGLQAVEKFSTRTYDLILMDCQMPLMDGLTATAEIRVIENDKQLARTPILAITANALASDRDFCIKAGMDDYLTKPFRRSQLREVLGKFLAAPSPEKSLASDPLPEMPNDMPVFDHDLMHEITGGDSALLIQIVSRFQEMLPAGVEKLMKLFKDLNRDGLLEALHKLRGGAASSGFCRLANCLGAVESEVKVLPGLNGISSDFFVELHHEVKAAEEYRLIEARSSLKG